LPEGSAYDNNIPGWSISPSSSPIPVVNLNLLFAEHFTILSDMSGESLAIDGLDPHQVIINYECMSFFNLPSHIPESVCNPLSPNDVLHSKADQEALCSELDSVKALALVDVDTMAAGSRQPHRWPSFENDQKLDHR